MKERKWLLPLSEDMKALLTSVVVVMQGGKVVRNDL